jgi:hypothetical protein
MDAEEQASASMAEEDEEDEDAGSVALGPQVPLKEHLQLHKARIIPHLTRLPSLCTPWID